MEKKSRFSMCQPVGRKPSTASTYTCGAHDTLKKRGFNRLNKIKYNRNVSRQNSTSFPPEQSLINYNRIYPERTYCIPFVNENACFASTTFVRSARILSRHNLSHIVRKTVVFKYFMNNGTTWWTFNVYEYFLFILKALATEIRCYPSCHPEWSMDGVPGYLSLRCPLNNVCGFG